ncbi:MAG: UvrD-helicase domain-containing protein [Spirochaetia bacterium]|nr:UvrD-helicase domain-containing protein [Spirochaetia bacterium]
MNINDSHIREKILNHDKSAFILAGAGTGKSTLLAQKIVNLIESKKPLNFSKLCAITYTKKAAAELKSKIKSEIYDRINFSGQKTINRQRLEKAFLEIDEAYIGTIHGFCVNILRKYPAEAEIDPLFQIIDGESSLLISDEITEEYFSNLPFKKKKTSKIYLDQNFLNELFQIEKNVQFDFVKKSLRSLIAKFYLLEKIGISEFSVIDLGTLENINNRLLQFHKENFLNLVNIYDYQKEIQVNPENSLGYCIHETITSLNKTSSWKDLHLMLSNLKSPGTIGSVKYINNSEESNTKILLDTIRSYLKLFMGRFDLFENDIIKKPYILEYFSSLNSNLKAITPQNTFNEYRRYLWYLTADDYHNFSGRHKKRRGFINYDDILFLTRKLFENASFLDLIKKDIEFLFVDEFQDTDPLQTEIFRKLSENNEHLTIFFVGDEKQSIYRFRGADVNAFLWQKEIFKRNKAGIIESLSLNYRSNESILNFVNAVFHDKIQTKNGLDLINYRNLYPVSTGNHTNELNRGVYLTFFSREHDKDKNEKDDKKYNSFERRFDEAFLLASEIKDLIENKNINPGKIAVLFQALTGIEDYLNFFEENAVPFEIIGRKKYDSNEPLKYMKFLLSFLADPFDIISLTGFLQSPFIGLCDQEIELLSEFDILHSFSIETEFQKNIKRLKHHNFYEITREFYFTIANLRNELSISPMPVLLDIIFRHFKFFQICNFYKNSDDLKSSLLKIKNRSREVIELSQVSQKNHSLQSMLNVICREIENLTGLVTDNEASISSFSMGQNKVQILSLHKSKGLEFDFVFLPDLSRKKKSAASDFYLEPEYEKDEIKARFHVSGDFTNNHLNRDNQLNIEIEKNNSDELNRLLYVGMTRAKKSLHLFLPELKSNDKNLLNKLMNSLYGKTDFSNYYESLMPDYQKLNLTLKENNSAISLNARRMKVKHLLAPERKDDLNKILKNKINQSLPNIKYESVSLSAASSQSNSKTYNLDNISPNASTFKNIKDPLPKIKKGIIIHQIFEHIDLYNPVFSPGVKNIIMNKNFLGASYSFYIEELAEKTLNSFKKSEYFKLICKSEIIGREIPFSYLKKSSNKLYIGYIDIAIRQKDKIYIVDYKSGALPKNIEDKNTQRNWLNNYLDTMNVYSKASEIYFQAKNIQSGIYHTESGRLFYF